MHKILSTTLTAVVLVGVGLACGYFAARQSADKPADKASDAPPNFSPQALKSLGVEVGKAARSSFVSYREVQAVIQDAPLNDRPITAPVAGVVDSIVVRPGAVIAAGGELMHLLRDAIPRPQMRLTEQMFRPVNEALHDGFKELRTANSALAITEKELARVVRINQSVEVGGVPLISGKTEIELGYQRDQQRQRVANARTELRHHGLSNDEIAAMQAGDHVPHGSELWTRVLKIHHLWTDSVEQIHKALPASARDLPWTIATLGELASAGLVDAALVQNVTKSKAMARRFVDCAGLLLAGQSLARVRWLADSGALAGEFAMRAPGPKGSDWDVIEILVRPGQSVVAGQTLAVLHDPRQMWLRLVPVGREIPVVLDALQKGVKVNARPLLGGVGPELGDLSIERLITRAQSGHPEGAWGESGEVAFARVQNAPLKTSGDSRSWRLRSGMRYVVRIPKRSFADVFVFGPDAVGRDGAERVVYLKNGDSFRQKPVHVLFEDQTQIVVARDGQIFAGEELVTRGAFAIGVALKRDAGGGHAGHGHPH